MRSAKFIAYYRVSTQKQGRSGLGLEAQKQTVLDYLKGDRTVLAGEYIEVESGKLADRPELERALLACRIHGASLIVAKVDRLSRSVGFLHKIIESGVDIRFCDLPELQGPTGRFMLNQMAAVAELEAGLISQRTKAALKAAKARGKRLGNPQNATRDGTLKGCQRGRQSQIDRSRARARDLEPALQDIRSRGLTTLVAIANALNERSIPTPRGCRWQAKSVQRLLARLSA